MYAQDPLSARACVQIRDGSTHPIHVVSVIHYNDSEAQEWVLRGLTSENSRLFRTLLQTERNILPQLDKVVFVSEFMRRTVIARVPEINKLPITVINNFTDDIVRTAKRHDPEGDIIAIGTFEPRKNQQFLLEVIAEARRIGKSYGMTIVGRGALEAELRRRSEELGIADLITFAGYVPKASRLISMHRCLAHAALIENMPITLIEALACSKPVLAPSVGGIPEIFTDGVEGFFWDTTNVRTATEKLIKLLETPDLYYRMSEAARRRYEQNFSRAAVAPQWLKVLLDETDSLYGHEGITPCALNT
jgi:glycosyltransferase involved in cell wall biosynthesis